MYVTRLFILFVFSALGIYFVWAGLTGIGASGEDLLISTFRRSIPEDKKTAENRAATLRILKANCGKCHQSSRPTAKPGALAIFDLDQKPWHRSVSDEHLEKISRSIGKRKGLSEADRAAVRNFIERIRKDRTSAH